jgi:hypothetical protein
MMRWVAVHTDFDGHALGRAGGLYERSWPLLEVDAVKADPGRERPEHHREELTSVEACNGTCELVFLRRITSLQQQGGATAERESVRIALAGHQERLFQSISSRCRYHAD